METWSQLSALLHGNLSAYVDRPYPRHANAYTRGIGVASKQPMLLLHVAFRAVSTSTVNQRKLLVLVHVLERSHEEQANSAVETTTANAVVRTVVVKLQTIPCNIEFAFGIAVPL